jgi:hypothetical protein
MDLVNKNGMNRNWKIIFNIQRMFNMSHIISNMYTELWICIIITLKVITIHHQ